MNLSAKPVLTGEKTVLRPFTASDADPMWQLIQDPEVVHFTFEPSTELTLERLRSLYGARATLPDRLDLAVTDPATRSCTFRTLIGPRGRDRGIGTEATRLILGYGFEQLGLHRVQLEVYGHNHRARRVYEKVGFVVEGVRREARSRDGEWVDKVVMGLLDREWSAHRGHPEGVTSTAR
ncbi:GNAT family protein [Streptomyces sp. N50]|uniref:GNAT family N-acetyltransferase n=1 Tax=Streptomyces sp. N50 TaxID=3081765 RepID=UPI0029621CFD|nr:GNAT family protein [Streptomyces sp. N50]WOX09799.1 GNAT family protein [Streptomyces sp. N50]